MAFPVELARNAAFELTNLLRDYKNNVVQGDTAYLRDADPESYIGKLAVATERRACRKWASEGVGKNAGTDAVMDGLCKLYLEDIGEYPGEPKVQDQDFTGGQCPGVEYDVAWVRRTNGAAQQGGTFTDDGPIRVIDESQEEDDGEWTISWRIEGANTSITVNGGINQPPPRSRYTLDVTPSRTDGLPDDCGDPPPVVVPPTPRPDPGPPSPTPIAPDFDVDIDVEFFPDGTFNIKFNFGGEGTDPEDDPVEIPVDPSPETREPGGEPGDPVTGTPGSEEEGEADEGEILVGILVEIDDFPDNANILFTPAGPVYKGPYYAYLGVEDRLDLQPEGSVARQVQFYFAPPDSTHWRVTANAGYTTTITPYYRPINEA